MKIGFIGAGKVGFSLGKFFAQGGLQVTGYYSRHRESAAEAAGFTGTEIFDDAGALTRASDAIFLTVPDGQITEVYRELRRSDVSEKIFCHCSGAMTASEAFPGVEEAGAFGYSIHPLFPVSSKLNSYGELSGAFFCIEGEGPHLETWREIFASLGARTQLIAGASKVKYHAACAFASNLVCGLVKESVELLTDCGFSPRGALEALAPLMRSNMEHLIADGPAGALTGPVERGDTLTVQKHLACFDSEEERELYRLLSLKLLETAAEKNPQRDYARLRSLLEKKKQGE